MSEPSIPNTTASGDPTGRDDAVAWLLSRINYERVAVLPYNERQLKLDRMRQLLTRLRSPDAGQRIVHIAGTKGKGSVAAMVASVLAAAGHRVGVYSSPHLTRIEERWAVDGKPCRPEELVDLVSKLRPMVQAMDDEANRNADSVGPPTFFDITTAMAFLHFSRRGCDVSVIEVGLGGRLDSTNVCLPAVSVITSISLDHTKQLGDTPAAIAAEKAGIIKPGTPVVSGVVEAEPREVIAATARERGCRLMERERDFGVTGDAEVTFWSNELKRRNTLAGVRPALAGPHQYENAAVALAAVAELRMQGVMVSDDACRTGLASVRLPARVERFDAAPGVRPATVVDSAHNEASAAALVASLEAFPIPGPRTLIAAISRDKQVEAIARTLAPHFDRLIATRYVDNPRAVEPDRLVELLRRSETRPDAVIEQAETPLAAWRRAMERTPPGGVIVVTGSFFIAAELRPLIAAREPV